MAASLRPAAPIDDEDADALLAPLAALPRLVIAVSGGVDSTALLVLAAEAKARSSEFPDLLAVTVDHRLRADSTGEARQVARLARRLGVKHRTLPWEGAKPSRGVPAAARAARYRLLGEAAARFGTAHVAVAHTLEDQAETVLMRLAAGSGPAGLAAMRAQEPRDDIVLHRPLLGISKARLIATVAARQIGWCEDPTNRDPRFERPRLRAAAEALAAEGLTAERLGRLAGRLARAEAAVAAAAAAAWSRLGQTDAPMVRFDRAAWAALPAEIALRLLGRAIDDVGTEGPAELGKLEALFGVLWPAAAAIGGGRLRRTLAGAVVTLSADRLTVAPAPPRRRH